MMSADGDPDPDLSVQGSDAELESLRSQADALRQELKTCRDELQKLQKQLSQSERLQKTTESYNKDLREQVEKLSAEIHERKRSERGKEEAETQTEEYTWTENDYYNYYYGGYSQSGTEAAVETQAQTQETVATETPQATDQAATPEEHPIINQTATPEEHPIINQTEHTIPEQTSEVTSNAPAEEASADAGSIADMLRATAEEALNQTNFVFDETSGMYYDHSTGFYYDSSSQLYYDANTGMYYYYDPESGKYQFHSRIEVPATQAEAEQTPQRKSKDWKNRKSAKNSDRASCGDGGDRRDLASDLSDNHHRSKRDNGSTHKRSARSRSRSPSTESPRRSRKKSRRRSRSRSDDSRKCRENGSCSEDGGKRKKKKKKKKRKSHRRRRWHSDREREESEPEEGEITDGSEGEKASTVTSSFSVSPAPPDHASPGKEAEAEAPFQEGAWPPCVRVTVVRSPVLDTGTLFILTADTVATIGREKDMNHAVRIPEMGVSKSHAEVYFDQEQQCYMLIDQGSQNGTVLNGNRIFQPKVRCEPCPLTHGDEVKMGETVLSFHIHTGSDTCDGCEPGQIIAHLSRFKRDDPAPVSGPVLSKEDKETQRQKELRMMKVKYGLKSSDYDEQKAVKNSRYKDRAESRRQTVGSEGTFQRDDAPASVHVEIGDENKGKQMLVKMGWKRGEGLGKAGAGMKDPIQLQLRKAQSGLGSTSAVSIEDAALTRTKTQRNWERARERFTDACHAQTLRPETSQSPQPWVKGQDAESSPGQPE